MKTTLLDPSQKEIQIKEDSQIVYLFVCKQGEEIHYDIDFVHNKPNIVSNILIKAILFDNAKFNLKGNLVINKGAKNVDSYLKIDVLLMSESASAEAVPSLEILENDVKGGHGASIGPVDEEQMFYLRSKGLDQKTAERVLSEGFVQDITKFFDEEIPEKIKEQISKLTN